MTAADIASALRGRRTADGWLCSCPLPSHGQGKGDRNPSLLVKDGDRAVVFSCFGGCDRADVVDEGRRLGLLDGTASSSPSPRLPLPAVHLPDLEAVARWTAAGPIAGTLAARYLEDHRGIPAPHPPSLRFAPRMVFPRSGLELPAMVAGVQAPDRNVVAVQVTYLRAADGRKAPVSEPRLTFGALGRGAVHLGPAGDVLGLAEGVEDALAAQHLTGVPCWACLGAARMHRVSIPPEVRELHIFCDDDEPGRAAAERTADFNSRIRVVIRLPPDGWKDWGEAIMERALA